MKHSTGRMVAKNPISRIKQVNGLAQREERPPGGIALSYKMTVIQTGPEQSQLVDGIALSDKMTVILPAADQSQFVDGIARP